MSDWIREGAAAAVHAPRQPARKTTLHDAEQQAEQDRNGLWAGAGTHTRSGPPPRRKAEDSPLRADPWRALPAQANPHDSQFEDDEAR